MFMKNILIYIGCCVFLSCSSEKIDENNIYKPFEQPANFKTATYNFGGENIKDEEAVFNLGRALFYEGKLSSDNSISCAECHNQYFAFTHHGHTLSAGVNEALGTRNAQPIQNMAFMDTFTWDGALEQLGRQPMIPITAEVEMNSTFEEVKEKLNKDNKYISLFKKAYHSGKITEATILKALGNFMGMMVSNNSKYDKYIRGEEGGTFTEQEKRGLETFNNKCATCHSGSLFTDESYRNNGLSVNKFIPNEKGRQVISEKDEDFYKFKVPSLRNVERSYPYMHDGRLSSLKKVLDFYDSKVEDTPNLDPLLKNGDRLGIPLTDDEKDDIIAFLKTLTDYEFLNDPRFEAP